MTTQSDCIPSAQISGQEKIGEMQWVSSRPFCPTDIYFVIPKSYALEKSRSDESIYLRDRFKHILNHSKFYASFGVKFSKMLGICDSEASFVETFQYNFEEMLIYRIEIPLTFCTGLSYKSDPLMGCAPIEVDLEKRGLFGKNDVVNDHDQLCQWMPHWWKTLVMSSFATNQGSTDKVWAILSYSTTRCRICIRNPKHRNLKRRRSDDTESLKSLPSDVQNRPLIDS